MKRWPFQTGKRSLSLQEIALRLRPNLVASDRRERLLSLLSLTVRQQLGVPERVAKLTRSSKLPEFHYETLRSCRLASRLRHVGPMTNLRAVFFLFTKRQII